MNSLAAILGAGLVGIDKTNQDGYNYVKMAQNYFNSDTGWNIVMNNTTSSVGSKGGGYGRDWWYDVLPNALYYAVCDVFPGVDGAESIQKSIAEQFTKADSVLMVIMIILTLIMEKCGGGLIIYLFNKM